MFSKFITWMSSTRWSWSNQCYHITRWWPPNGWANMPQFMDRMLKSQTTWKYLLELHHRNMYYKFNWCSNQRWWQCVTVTMTVAMDTTWADSNDHDPSFGISDGEKCIGLIIIDKTYFPSSPLCYSIQLKETTWITFSQTGCTGPRPSSPRGFSGEVKIQIDPGESWGSCHTEHDEGFVIIKSYQHTLDLTKGLFFDVYQHDAPEIYRIEYFTVDVIIN